MTRTLISCKAEALQAGRSSALPSPGILESLLSVPRRQRHRGAPPHTPGNWAVEPGKWRLWHAEDLGLVGRESTGNKAKQ